MNIHYFQHADHEGIYKIEEWAVKKQFPVNSTKFFLNWNKPDKIDKIDFLIIMGGPMGVYEENIYPWLTEEKKLIENAIKKNKKVLGICLGAQLIADVLGAKVYKNKYKEIGWYPVYKTKTDLSKTIIKDFPDEINVMHWHNDTFDIPEGAIHFAFSKACINQGFLYDNRVLGLQFHIETNLESIMKFVKNSEEDLKDESQFVQAKDEIISKTNDNSLICNNLLFKILNNFIK